MFKRSCLALALIWFTTASLVYGQTNSDWFRHAAISPNGDFVAFSYQGDIYLVSSKGGTARPLTIHGAWDGHPIWSRDNKKIAFASDRHGGLDVFVMPAKGGQATRLTFDSANDVPTDFSPDGKSVLFRSSRGDDKNSSLFPTGALAELYLADLAGGTPRMISTLPASEARFVGDGNKILYRDEKSYESPYRKHDVSAFARDVWSHDLKTGQHNQLTDFVGGDHNPVWDGDGGVYYLSEANDGQGDNDTAKEANKPEDGNNSVKPKNSFNVWWMKLDGSDKRQETRLKVHAVRNLSYSTEDTLLAFTHHGSIYTQAVGEQPKRLSVQFANDSRANSYETKHLKSGVTEFAVSPNGKEVAFIARGEIFVTSRDFSTTKRITNTPEQERSVSFHKDGRTLLYAGERGGKWKLFETSLDDEREKYFFAATKLKEKQLHAADTESFQPVYSPDGKKVAFLSQRDAIHVLDRASGDTHIALDKVHNYSYTDGDITFAWSADSNWLISDYAPRQRLFIPNIGIFPAGEQKEPVDISRSGYQDSGPSWSSDGNVVYWLSSRYGQRDHGSWGREYDVIATFLTQEAYDQFQMNKEEHELKKELDEKKAKDDDKKKDDAVKPIDLTYDELKSEDTAEELADRTVRLTRNSSNIQQAVLTKNAKKLLYLSQFDGRAELWERDFVEGSTKLVKKFGGQPVRFELSKDEKSIFFLAGSTLSHAELGSIEKSKPISFNAVMELKPREERAFMFEHAWRQIQDKFYKKPDYHDIDWDLMKAEYQAKLPSIGNNRDFAEMLAEMTGELNASHIGASYRASSQPEDDSTASLGLIFDMTDTSGPLTITEVLDKSPLKKAKSRVSAGDKLVKIDGVELGKNANLATLLNNKIGKRVRLSIKVDDGTNFDVITKPISRGAESQLRYERWVKSRRQLVEKESKGRLGYVHIRGMNDPSFRVAYSEILGRNFDKEAIVVDTRWNGGGWLHNDLAKLLMGQEYVTMHVRGREYRGDSLDQWNKPSILVMGEGNYSDAHAFPYTYNVLKIGEMVGMPVPGTMTAVWWETMISGDVRFGVPQVGMKNKKGEYLENNQTEPDHLIKNDPQSSAAGEDKQLVKAVEKMLESLDKKP